MPTADNANARNQSADSGVKETIESILIAFILAFIFRAFVVEAFVIPTGSMAPTLMGAHMRYRCADCGYRFEVNYPTEQRDGELNIPPYAKGNWDAFCPNCGLKVPQDDPEDPENDASMPPVRYGDRILVLKYLYLFSEPKRWDVVVFKSPEPTGLPPNVPESEYDYSVNYIKRLVAKPGESIMILDGDVFIAPKDSRELAQDFQIQTKPDYAQQSLWRIVYDNDFHPQGRSRGQRAPWRQPWTEREGSGWNTDGSVVEARTFDFDNLNGAGKLSFDADANLDQYSLTDWVAYDTDAYGVTTARPGPVTDVKLDLFYERKAGDGALRMRLTKSDDAFIAEVTPTSVRLLRQSPGTERQIGDTVSLTDTHRPMHVELSNVDYQVSVRIDGKLLLQTATSEYHPDVAKLIQAFRDNKRPPHATIDISAAKQQCTLSHVSLWRDVYYTSKDAKRASGTRPVHLGADEYFVLGDNSAISGDARYWHMPISLPAEDLRVEEGRVPGRFLLGKAFFVYWPAGYRPLPGALALAPDFGDMRFIR